MKREAVGHTKMKRLCRRMDIPLWQAVGLLESLWHLTARECPAGDIGKLSDEDIALALDYRGDESAMIEAVCSVGSRRGVRNALPGNVAYLVTAKEIVTG
jgi:hypothetical protein